MSSTACANARSEEMWARGHRIHFKVEGEGSPLLLINGLTRPLASWEPFVAALGPRMVISFDAPGVGDSDVPLWPLTIPQLAEVAVEVLDHLELSQADVLGYSHGGAVAQEFAYRYPDRVRRLVLVATLCGVGSTLGDLDAPDTVDLVTNALFRANPLSTIWRTMAITAWSSIPFLGSISAPTLVVCGIDDQVVPIANGRVLAERIPNATLVELPESHDFQRPAPAARLAHVVDEFFETTPAPRR